MGVRVESRGCFFYDFVTLVSGGRAIRHTSDDGSHHIPRQSPVAELSFITLTIHLCNGPNDKNLVKPRKTCFLSL